ncbi:MAG: PEP-CTERM sorting domain-containing protein, partial [Verrucomicrobiaceae bacterium]
VDNVRLDMNVVPEPGSLMLGLAGSAFLLRRRK